MQRSYVIGFLGVIVIAVIIVLILNYFQVISVPKILPPFGSSPKTAQTIPAQTRFQKEFGCPVDSYPCPEAEKISTSVNNPDFQGLGYKYIPPQTDVMTIMAGNYKFKQGSGTDFIDLQIKNQDYRVTYLFVGKPLDLPLEGVAIEDQLMAVTSGELRGQKNYGKLYGLIISIKDLKTGKYLKLNPSDNGLSIE